MIRKFRSLCAKILSRILPAPGVHEKGFDARAVVQRRVEVTVERELVSVMVTGRPADSAGGAASGKGGSEAPCLELLPTVPSTVAPTVKPTGESPAEMLRRKAGDGKP